MEEAESNGSLVQDTVLDIEYNLIEHTLTQKGLNIDNSLNTTSDSQNNSFENDNFTDPYDGVLYNVSQSDSRTTIVFISRPIFDSFVSKVMSDFALIIDENLNFSTHEQTLKCNISIDKYAATVTTTGLGHKLWRSNKFIKTARFLLKRYFQNPTLEKELSPWETSAVTDISETSSIEKVSQPQFTSTPVIN